MIMIGIGNLVLLSYERDFRRELHLEGDKKMTNFEWLVKTRKLDTFVFDVYSFDGNIMHTDYFFENYGLKLKLGESISKTIADWLTNEHKTTKYVALDEVLNLFNRPMKVDSLKSKFSDTEVYHLIAENCCDIKNAILNLNTKEIDE